MNHTVAVVFCSVENRTPIGRNGADGGSGLIQRVGLGGAGGGAVTSGVSGGDAGCNGQIAVGLEVGACDIDREDLAVTALADLTCDDGAIDVDADGVAHRHITADGAGDRDRGGITFCNVHHVVRGDAVDHDRSERSNGVDREEIDARNCCAVAGRIRRGATDGDGALAEGGDITSAQGDAAVASAGFDDGTGLTGEGDGPVTVGGDGNNSPFCVF